MSDPPRDLHPRLGGPSGDGSAGARSSAGTRGGDTSPAAVPIVGASEHVAQAIRLCIADQGLQPGDRLGREEDLARQFGVSRPTLREALRLLAGSGRVRASKGPGGGIFVHRTVEEGLSESVSSSIALMLETAEVTLEELIATRRLFEVPLAGAAAQQATKHDIDELRHANQHFADTGDVAWDAQFHRVVARTAGNRVARALGAWTFDVLQPSLVAVVDLVEYGALVEQHAAIVDAIDRRDVTGAEDAARAHLDYLAGLLARAGRRRPRRRAAKSAGRRPLPR